MKKVYKSDRQTAERRGELDQWRKSMQLNRDCCEALMSAIRQGYDTYSASSIDVKPVAEQYGYERILWVIANSINHHDEDVRVSRGVIQWAKKMGIPDDRENRDFLLNDNPGLISTLAGMVQKEAEAAKKPRLTLYRHSRGEAERRGELDRWQASYDKNVECARTLTKAIDEGFEDVPGAVRSVVESFGIQRVIWVLANTVQTIDRTEPRIGADNRAWAKEVPVPCEGKDMAFGFYVYSHPSHVDSAIHAVRQILLERLAPAAQETAAQEDGGMEDER